MYEEDHFTRASADGATQATDSPPSSLPGWRPADANPAPFGPLSPPDAAAPEPGVPGWPPSELAPEPLGPPSPAIALRRATPAGPTIYVWQLLLIIATITGFVAAAVVLFSGGSQAASPLKVPIELRGWPGGPHGVMPIVRVRIGDGPPLPVLLDTGSTGLNLLARDLPAGTHTVPLSSFSETWGGGNLTSGRQALANVSIDGASTTRQIVIGLVQSVGCVPRVPHCFGWADRGVDGVLGIRAEPRFLLTNPLAALPRPYSQSWSIGLSSTAGTLELGAPIPAHPTAAFALSGVAAGDPSLPPGLVPAPAPPTPAPTSSPTALSPRTPTGVPFDLTGSSTICWQVGRRARRLCVPTVFDTGSTDTVLFSRTGVPPTRALGVGRSLTAWSSSGHATPVWSFTSGSTASEDVVLTDGRRLALMDTGIAAFYRFKVTYDGVHGRMYLSPGAGVAGGALWRRSADAVCSTFNARAKAALEAGPHARAAATLEYNRRADAYYLRTWGAWSLKADDAFARVELPPALRPVMAGAVAADRAASRMMIRLAPTLARYRTAHQLARALQAFRGRYMAAEGPWENAIERLKIAGCA